MSDDTKALRVRLRRLQADRAVERAELVIPTTGRLLAPEDTTLDRLLNRTNREFGDPTKDIGGPALPRTPEGRRGK